MDAIVKQMIDGYAAGFEAHAGRLGADHPRFRAAAATYAELVRAGEGAADIGAFCASAGSLLEAVGSALAALADVPTPEGAGSSAAGGPPPVGQALGASRAGHLAIARDGAAACRGLSQPCMEHHYAELERTLEQVGTETELEYEVNRLVELNSVEGEWDTLLVHYLMKAIGETAGLLMDPGPAQQQTVENSYRFVCDFFGRDWDAMLRHPRVWDFWCLLFEKSRNTWIVERQCHTPEQARDYLTRLFEAVMGGRAPVPLGPPEGQLMVLWDRTLHLDDIPDAYRNPPRPAVDFSEG
jgi:hypothetical protein